ncbi:MAG: hypothetical protein ACLTER_26195 [Ruminococcus sp.]
MVWTESAKWKTQGDTVSAVSSDEMAAEESWRGMIFQQVMIRRRAEALCDDAGRWQWKYGKIDAGRPGNASFTGMTDGNPSQSEDLSDGFSDGGTDELQ